jgi:hypothetical protein
MQFLVENGIDSISLNPDSLLKTTAKIVEMERILEATKQSTNGSTTPCGSNDRPKKNEGNVSSCHEAEALSAK